MTLPASIRETPALSVGFHYSRCCKCVCGENSFNGLNSRSLSKVKVTRGKEREAVAEECKYCSMRKVQWCKS